MYKSTNVDQSKLLTDIGLYASPFVFVFFYAMSTARLYIFRRQSLKFLVRSPA